MTIPVWIRTCLLALLNNLYFFLYSTLRFINQQFGLHYQLLSGLYEKVCNIKIIILSSFLQKLKWQWFNHKTIHNSMAFFGLCTTFLTPRYCFGLNGYHLIPKSPFSPNFDTGTMRVPKSPKGTCIVNEYCQFSQQARTNFMQMYLHCIVKMLMHIVNFPSKRAPILCKHTWY